MTRSDALAAYEKLPLPDTTEEHWRFTDLRGFDPDAFDGRGDCGDRDDARPRRRGLRDGHGRRDRDREGARGGHLRAAARGARASLLPRRLGREVRGPQRGALAARAARRRPEGRRAGEAALRPDLRDWPDVLAAGGRRRGGRTGVADRGVRVARRTTPRPTRTRSPSSSSSRRRSSSTSRSRTSRARRGTSRTTTRASSATPSSTGSPAASARRRARRGSRTTSTAAARPRA